MNEYSKIYEVYDRCAKSALTNCLTSNNITSSESEIFGCIILNGKAHVINKYLEKLSELTKIYKVLSNEHKETIMQKSLDSAKDFLTTSFAQVFNMRHRVVRNHIPTFNEAFEYFNTINNQAPIRRYTINDTCVDKSMMTEFKERVKDLRKRFNKLLAQGRAQDRGGDRAVNQQINLTNDSLETIIQDLGTEING